MSRFGQDKVIATPQDVARLADLFSRCPEVTRFDTPETGEAWALADSLADLEGSFRDFLNEQLPKLATVGMGPAEAYETLLDIGEEFRHILYHIIDHQRFYKYLVPDGTTVFGNARDAEKK
jgi:hypothetical protein